MALEAIKALAKEMTKPPAALTALGTVQRATPYTRTTLQDFVSNDPISDRLEEAEQRGNPNIDNSGRAVLRVRNHSQELNDIYGTQAEKEEAERAENNGYTEAELKKIITLAYIDLSTPESSIFSPNFTIQPPPSYRAADQSYIGSNGQKYTEIYDANGKLAYINGDHGCFIPKAGLAATTPAAVNDDLISADQAARINTKIDANGNIVPRDAADANFQLAMTRMDNKYTKLPSQLNMIDRITAEVSHVPGADVKFSSAAPTPIQTDVKPTVPFSAAVIAADAPETKSIVFKTPRAVAPWEKQPTAAAPLMSLEPTF